MLNHNHMLNEPMVCSMNVNDPIQSAVALQTKWIFFQAKLDRREECELTMARDLLPFAGLYRPIFTKRSRTRKISGQLAASLAAVTSGPRKQARPETMSSGRIQQNETAPDQLNDAPSAALILGKPIVWPLNASIHAHSRTGMTLTVCLLILNIETRTLAKKRP